MRLSNIPIRFKKYIRTMDARHVQITLGIAILMVSMFVFGRSIGSTESDEYYQLLRRDQESVLGTTRAANLEDADEVMMDPEDDESVEANSEPVEIPSERISEIQRNLLEVIPAEYKLLDNNSIKPSSEDDGCYFIAQVFPESYTNLDIQYLMKASIQYCSDIHRVVLYYQSMELVRYDPSLSKWTHGDDRNVLEEVSFGDNKVTMTELGGSHASLDTYILRIPESDELIMLTIPSSNRIRCDTIENGREAIILGCLDYIASIGIESDDPLWVPDELYRGYYENLTDILKFDFRPQQ